MVDWMCEVLNIAFKHTCTDQTFFLAVSILDRYLMALEKKGQSFKSAELHVTGVACMFIASKYEDIHPLHLKTVVAKIGHDKIAPQPILAREQDILQTLGFQVGGTSPLEFIGSFIESSPLLRDHADKELLTTIAIYLAKMSLHHGDLYTLASSQIAASSIFVANKIYEQMVLISQTKGDSLPSFHLSEKVLLEVLTKQPSTSSVAAGTEISLLVHNSMRLL